MKLILYFSVVFSVFMFSFKEAEVSSQQVLPYYGGGLTYTEDKDDDIGILLSILLLAARNRGNCGCCNCCNCGGNNIPIPYPIPFPTNNPIINTRRSKGCDDDEKDSDEDNGKDEVINIVTTNEESANSFSAASDTTKNTSNNNASAGSAASSGASASS